VWQEKHAACEQLPELHPPLDKARKNHPIRA
jgi:hypothetical protein